MGGGRLGPYRILAELGSGSTARVYLAEVVGEVAGLEPGRRVALKVLHAEFEAAPKALGRFLREAQLGRAICHENVARVLDAGAFVLHGQTRHFLATEYVQGQTLRELLDEEGRQQESLCRHLGAEVACGLAAIHRVRVVHRDVKPENVLITRDQQVKIMDLGLARIRDEAVRLSQSGDFIGSFLYAAPEHFDGRRPDVDGRADLHALGLTLYEMATGVHPFASDTIEEVVRRLVSDEPRRPGEINPQISPFFEHVLLTLLAKDREQRFPDAEVLLDVLRTGEDSAWWCERSQVIRRASRRPLRRIRLPRETALHGREGEMRDLHDLWTRVKEGEGRVLLLLGEAGIGKSRLVDGFAARLDASGEDLHYLFGACPSGGAATAAGALCTAYREHFGSEDLEASLAPHLAASPALVHPFAALLRGDPPSEGVDAIRPDALQAAFLRTTCALAKDRPTLVLIEDLQYAPAEGLAIIAALAHGVAGQRILLVGTARPELSETWIADLAGQPYVTTISLPRLGRDAVGTLVEEALGSTRVAAELTPRIASLSDGNPLFVFEILGNLRDSGVLVREPEGGWTLRGSAFEVTVPPAMRDLIRARVAGLDAQDRELLDAAAVCGFEFDPDLVAVVLDRRRIPVLKALGRLERDHRLVRSRGRRCSFDHHQLQETLCEELPALLCEEYHAVIGDALGRRLAASADEGTSAHGADFVETCHHFLVANRGGAALPLLDAALAHLEEGLLDDRAVKLIDRVLAVKGLVEGTKRASLLLRSATRLGILGRRHEEAVALEEAVRLAHPRSDPLLACRVRVRLGDHLRMGGHAERALEFLTQAVDLARAAGSRREEAEALGSMGTALDELGRYEEARDHHLRHLEHACRAGDPQAEAKARGNLGITQLQIGEIDEALTEFRHSLALFEEIGDLYKAGGAAGNLGFCLLEMGRFDEAFPYLERSLEVSRQVGYRSGEGRALGNLGSIHQTLGRLGEAQACFDAALAIQRECGTPLDQGLVLHNLGEVEFVIGRLDRSRGHLEDALACFRQVGHRKGEGYAQWHLARVADEKGETDEADALFQEALAIHREMGAVREAASLRADRARAWFWRGDEDAAHTELAAALDEIQTSEHDDTIVLAFATLAALGRMAPGRVRRELEDRAAHLTPAARLEVHALLWRAEQDPADLEEARRLLQEAQKGAPADARDGFLESCRLHRFIGHAGREEEEAGRPAGTT